jgi:phage anti-repressor protein
MKRILVLFIFITVYSGTHAQAQNCSVVLNHFLIVVDSTTYKAILNSEILNSNFAYSHEKKLKDYSGIYIVGQDNYIEIFHPKSYLAEDLPVGFTWICQASLVANCTEKYDLPNNDFITYASNDFFDELSVHLNDVAYKKDSSALMTTWEINKKQYESWIKKPFNDSLHFQTTDYNSAAESDSSKNYLFKNITGLRLNLNQTDSIQVTQYLTLIGYTVESSDKTKITFSNSIDFIELDFSKDVEFASISMIYFKLNQLTELKRITIGSSEILMEGTTGKWEINKPSLIE